MAVMQRLRCSAQCGASEFDAMVEKQSVGKGKRRSAKLLIIDRTPDDDGFPNNNEVDAVCTECGAALEIRMMVFAIGGRARAVSEEGGGGLRIQLGRVARHVGERHSFHNCDGDGDGEVFEATVQGPLIAPQDGENGPKLVEVGGVAARDDGSTFTFGSGCTHSGKAN